MEFFGESSTASALKESHCLGEDTSDAKILGVRWRPLDDVLVFHVELGEVTFTRRGLLSKMARIYDPLGLLSPTVIQAKIIHRTLGLRGLNWHEDIPADQRKWWQRWIEQLDEIKSLSIPRCLFAREDDILSSELHTFCDASQDAFAAAVYIQNAYTDGQVTVRIVMAKTKLAPLKTISIARLELQAALLGARLAAYVGRGLTRLIRRRLFWTDSSCVRNWIRSSAAYYKLYVNHRIGEIQTITDPSEWRFVPGRLNVTDYVTRSTMKQRELFALSWFYGPEFLRGPEDSWPADLPWVNNTEEIRPLYEGQVLLAVAQHPPNLPYVDDLIPDESAGFTRFEGKFLEALKMAQDECFARDLADLKGGKELKRRSVLLPFTPFLDENDLMRIGGRLQKAALPYDNRHPVLVCARHPLSRRITEEFHQRLKHAGIDAVLSAIRQHFWFIRGRQLANKIRSSCQQCAEESAQTGQQLMAELPTERVAVGCPPFYHTSVDYFGPLEVMSGWSRRVKRYGMIFTCLTVRAVYLDMARSLSAEDFLLVLRRFISVYGKPV